MPSDPNARDKDVDLAVVVETLAGRPQTLKELSESLAERGVHTEEAELLSLLSVRPEPLQLLDGAWAWLPALLDGAVLTHDLTPEELELGVLDAEDLDPWAQLADEGLALAGGGEVTTRWSAGNDRLPAGAANGLAGPPGWLSGFEAEDRLGLRLRRGVLHLEKTPEVEEDSTDEQSSSVSELMEALARLGYEVARQGLRDYYDEELESYGLIPGAAVSEVVAEVRHRTPTAFDDPLPPLSLLLETFGLEMWRGYVGVPGAPWPGEQEHLDEAEQRVVQVWAMALTGHRLSGDAPPPLGLASLAGQLRPDAVLREAAERIAAEPDGEPVAAALADASTGAARAVGLYLRACALQGRGDLVAMEPLLEEAVALDRDLSPALADLAELKALRGQVEQAWQLYQRSSIDLGFDQVAVLKQFLRKPEGAVSRNQPCPCGSGRKYKLCHGSDLRHPLPKRAGWLWIKATTSFLRDLRLPVHMHFADMVAAADSRSEVDGLVDHPLVVDLAMFDGGLLKFFLEECGPLLPDDESALARSWLDTERRILEAEAVLGGRGATFRDLLSGQRVEVEDRALSEALAEHDVVYARPLPDGGGGVKFFGDGLFVPEVQRAPLTELLRSEPAGENVASWFRSMSADIRHGRRANGPA